MKKESIGIALLGFGNVGSGTYRVLEENAALISKRVGADVCVRSILVRDLNKERSVHAPAELFTDDFEAILSNPDIHIVAELMGGIEPAVTYMERALVSGRHVVSANKEALARFGGSLTERSQELGLMLRYEAAVCGAIPVMNAISTALGANEITRIQGILNGTTNYILTRMGEEGAPYEQVLKQAQDLGFAEADPTADVEGHDAANKLSLLIAAAFGDTISPDNIDCTGITGVTKDDLDAAAVNGETIKLIATAEKENGALRASVRPVPLPSENPLARVRNEFNAVLISCNMADDIFLQGRGAGPLPTGSAVAGDLLEIAACIVRETAGRALPTRRLP